MHEVCNTQGTNKHEEISLHWYQILLGLYGALVASCCVSEDKEQLVLAGSVSAACMIKVPQAEQ